MDLPGSSRAQAADTTRSASSAYPALPSGQRRSNVMNTEQVAKRLVELCREGKYEEAQDQLYSKDAVSVEMEGSQGLGNAKGLEAIREKGKQFNAMVEAVHGGS